MRNLFLFVLAFAFFAFKTQGQSVTYDGFTYHTVTIGTQVWMVENLRATHYRNSDPIPNLTNDGDWVSATSGAYCYQDNDINNRTDYGCLYNGYTVLDSRNIAPSGWHVPTVADWTTLANYLGGFGVAGGKLKEAGYTHWFSPNSNATNESGFTGLPGGYRGGDYANFEYLGNYGFWWSSTEPSSGNLNYYFTAYDDGNLYNGSWPETAGFSVRLVKDTTPVIPSPTIPTMSQWGLIILGLILLSLGVVYISRKRRFLIS
jgi:uncharacterized protein (TIGR02145 family)